MDKELFKKYLDLVHQVATILSIVIYLVALFVIDFNDQEIVNKVLCYGFLFVVTAHKGVEK